MTPPWDVLVLDAHHLDPKTLATATCVCKTWSISMSSDQLWGPICSTHFPTLSNLRAVNPAVPYRRLYALGHASAKRRGRQPQTPRLSLDKVIFAVELCSGGSHVVTTVKPGSELSVDPHGLFRFDIDVLDENLLELEALEGMKLTWNVVLKGFGGVFTMMDCTGKGSFVSGSDGWFSEELPSSGCCFSSGTSGLVADLRLGLRDIGGRMKVEKVVSINLWIKSLGFDYVIGLFRLVIASSDYFWSAGCGAMPLWMCGFSGGGWFLGLGRGGPQKKLSSSKDTL
ncbi:hypothetical protein RJ640_027627 [Escallonia rubra]|uniref:F-box protein n=1 Tax=Escallonia rubra TaxID=112253 RepID=A0AA88QIT3_9ASTE|nr:hypothetical protein RJ640_027627 [Escallonia rubra]